MPGLTRGADFPPDTFFGAWPKTPASSFASVFAAAVRALPTPCASIEVGESEEIVEDEARPIHQLPRYELAWQAPDRAAAKALAKELAMAFGHAPKKASGGKSTPRVKAGKSRRHGGYGI